MRVKIFTFIILVLFLFSGFTFAEVVQVTSQESLQGEPVMMRGRVVKIEQNMIYVEILSEVNRGDTFEIIVSDDFFANKNDFKSFLYDGKGHVKFIEGKGDLR